MSSSFTAAAGGDSRFTTLAARQPVVDGLAVMFGHSCQTTLV